MTNNEAGFFFKEKNIKWILRLFYLLCAISVAADFFIHRHVDHPWESIFSFYAIYGFVSCVVLVVIAKEMRKLLMRDENYYEDQ